MHPCPHCAAEFDSLRSLEHHLKTHHTETLPNEKSRCTTCDEEFLSQMTWLHHVSEHESSELEAAVAAVEDAG